LLDERDSRNAVGWFHSADGLQGPSNAAPAAAADQ
jgi:hypothetical protein